MQPFINWTKKGQVIESPLAICLEIGEQRRRLTRCIPVSFAAYHAPVAQLDRVGGFEPLGREFESLRVRQYQRVSVYITANPFLFCRHFADSVFFCPFY